METGSELVSSSEEPEVDGSDGSGPVLPPLATDVVGVVDALGLGGLVGSGSGLRGPAPAPLSRDVVGAVEAVGAEVGVPGFGGFGFVPGGGIGFVLPSGFTAAGGLGSGEYGSGAGSIPVAGSGRPKRGLPSTSSNEAIASLPMLPNVPASAAVEMMVSGGCEIAWFENNCSHAVQRPVMHVAIEPLMSGYQPDWQVVRQLASQPNDEAYANFAVFEA